MGFFSELKSDLSQAVNTLMPEDKPEAEGLNEDKAPVEAPKPVDLDSMLTRLDDIKLDEVAEKVRRLGIGRRMSVRTALVYSGRLSPAVEAEGFFDVIVDAASLLSGEGESHP